ncbi:hypothetical protein ABIA38_005527 [Embleya sp. AB8]
MCSRATPWMTSLRGRPVAPPSWSRSSAMTTPWAARARLCARLNSCNAASMTALSRALEDHFGLGTFEVLFRRRRHRAPARGRGRPRLGRALRREPGRNPPVERRGPARLDVGRRGHPRSVRLLRPERVGHRRLGVPVHPLVEIRPDRPDGPVTVRANRVRGAKAVAVRGDRVVFYGGYGEQRDRLAHGELAEASVEPTDVGLLTLPDGSAPGRRPGKQDLRPGRAVHHVGRVRSRQLIPGVRVTVRRSAASVDRRDRRSPLVRRRTNGPCRSGPRLRTSADRPGPGRIALRRNANGAPRVVVGMVRVGVGGAVTFGRSLFGRGGFGRG